MTSTELLASELMSSGILTSELRSEQLVVSEGPIFPESAFFSESVLSAPLFSEPLLSELLSSDMHSDLRLASEMIASELIASELVALSLPDAPIEYPGDRAPLSEPNDSLADAQPTEQIDAGGMSGMSFTARVWLSPRVAPRVPRSRTVTWCTGFQGPECFPIQRHSPDSPNLEAPEPIARATGLERPSLSGYSSAPPLNRTQGAREGVQRLLERPPRA